VKWLDGLVKVSEVAIEEAVEGAKETAVADATDKLNAVSAVLVEAVSPSIAEQGEELTQKTTMVGAVLSK
jgi:hypothetical protein